MRGNFRMTALYQLLQKVSRFEETLTEHQVKFAQ